MAYAFWAPLLWQKLSNGVFVLITWFNSTSLRLPLLYGLFAGIAMATNLAAQAILMHFYTHSYAMLISMLLGTGTGLITKYILDKQFVFVNKDPNTANAIEVFI